MMDMKIITNDELTKWKLIAKEGIMKIRDSVQMLIVFAKI